ncbi:GNAT family N-acetyltransferase [uncultured Abyssibacter sp.]|uniref:GNAT family N-acetyltransferase n=1 Tax=uncultured Abyssibacter sp. TaxID=2320202 RepID=UPI0032B11CF8
MNLEQNKPEARTRPTLHLQRMTAADEAAFLAAVDRSRSLHGQWVSPPATIAAFQAHVRHYASSSDESLLARRDNGGLVGCINISNIVRGGFQSAYLGYYAFEPHAGQGLMRQALRLAVSLGFTQLGLHRLEANVQPTNHRSARLVRSLGFRLEGHSPRYLKIAGHWRDHDRYAITTEEWRMAN